MPKLRDTIGNIVQELDEIRSREEINWRDGSEADVTTAYDFGIDQIRAEYKQDIIAKVLTEEIKKLPDETLKKVFKDLKGKDGNELFTEASFLKKCKGRDGLQLFDKKYWGTTADTQVLDVLDKYLSDEAKDRIINVASNIKTPDDPGYTGKKDREPYKEKIEDLKKKVNLENPFAAESNSNFLNNVNKHLTDVDSEYREYFDKIDHITGKNDMTKAADYTFTHLYRRGIKTVAGGQFNGVIKMPKNKQNNAPTVGYTFMANDDKQVNRELTDQEIETLKEMKSPLSEDAINGISDVMKDFDSPEYVNDNGSMEYSGSMTLFAGQKQGDRIYMPELNEKYYAFIPLANAKTKLREAVDSGDMDAIKKADEEFVKIDNKMTSMMNKIKDPKNNHGMLFDGNVNPTRSSTAMMPSKFVEDPVNATKLNTLYTMHVLGKNTNMDPMEFVKEPVKAPIKAYEQYKQANGVNSRKGIGSSLCWNMQASKGVFGETEHSNYRNNYDNYIEFARARGQNALLNFEPDKQKRDEFAALCGLGAYTAAQYSRKEMARFEVMEEISSGKKNRSMKETESMDETELRKANAQFAKEAREKRNALYENAALLSEDEFDMEKIADAFLDPNTDAWRSKLSVADKLKPEKLWDLDLNELAKRPEEIIRQHDEEMLKSEVFQSSFDRNEFLVSSFGVYSNIIKNASADLRGTEGFRKLQETVRNMPNLATDPSTKALLNAGVKTLDDPNYFKSLSTSKKDRILSGDSGAYTEMKDSIEALENRTESMMTVPKTMDDTEFLKKGASFEKALNEAAEKTFAYASSRSKFGSKTSFSAESGRQRVEESYQTLDKIYKLQDEAGLRSHARKIYEDSRLELMKNRSNKQWLEQNGMEYVKRMVNGKRIMDAGIPDKDIENAFKPDNWESISQSIGKNKGFADFVKGKKLDAIVGEALSGGKSFKRAVSGMTQNIKAFHQKHIVEPAEKKAQAEMKKNYAISLAKDAAAEKIGLIDLKVDDRNPRIQAEYKNIMKEPEFNAVVDRVLRVQPLENRPLPIPIKEKAIYRKTKEFMEYERRCAEICVEKLKADKLEGLGPEQRKEELQKQTDKLMNDPNYKDIMDEKLETALSSGQGYVQGLIDKLKQPGGADRMVNEISTEMEERHQEAEAKKLAQNQVEQPEAEKQVENNVEPQRQSIGMVV